MHRMAATPPYLEDLCIAKTEFPTLFPLPYAPSRSPSRRRVHRAARSASTAPADGERVVIRVQPIDPVTFERQRREALFRSLDNDTDGRISISEAKVNHQFVDAFARLDRDGNGGIDRQEFERVQLEDDAKSARVAR